MRLFDIEDLPGGHAIDLQRLQRSLQEATHQTRAERAPDLGLSSLSIGPRALLERMRHGALGDWAEMRPEWGLGNNATFIVAPRSRTCGLDLDGRSVLHDYTWTEDADGPVLELIMTAPMVVTHWINPQYYASTVDPERFGSGNKVLHNVACGRIAVFEGNTGDSCIGLSRQSVHNGERLATASRCSELTAGIDPLAGQEVSTQVKRVCQLRASARYGRYPHSTPRC